MSRWSSIQSCNQVTESTTLYCMRKAHTHVSLKRDSIFNDRDPLKFVFFALITITGRNEAIIVELMKILCLQNLARHTHNALLTKWRSRCPEIIGTSSFPPTLTYFIAGGILIDVNTSGRMFVKNETFHKFCAPIKRCHSTDMVYLYFRMT